MLFRDHNVSINLAVAIAIVWNTQLFAFAGNTHKAITQEAVNRSVLAGDYLDKQLGLTNELGTELELLGQFQSNLDMRVSQEPDFVWSKTKISILDWLKDGSELEDVPNPRARHHFYDPLRNSGLDNSAGPWLIIKMLKTGSKKKYPDYWAFDATGASSFDRAIGNAGVWETEYLNYYYWDYARGLFYAGLTEQSKATREKYLGSMFVTLGHICHLLEDQGVPAHTRNDFIWGHMVGGYYDVDTPLKDGGNPFEIWVEAQIKGEGNTIPSSWLNGADSNIPAFSSLRKYWDADAYSGQYVGATTLDNWGLCERTNYQFLSFSTMFRNDGTLYAYPNPSKTNAPVNPEFVNGRKHYYRSGYDVPHLARVTYSTYTSQSLGYTTTYEEDALEEDNVSNDYAQRTVPRTIDYATGLLNYFFRGKLSIEQTDCNDGKIIITITNKSSNSGVSQILKGGTFTLYWDDSSGNRTQVSDFTVYQPGTQPGDGNEWNSNTLLNYDESTKAVLALPESNDVNCILVYEGTISSNPNSPDADDTRQIATAVKKLCGTCCEKIPPGFFSCLCGREYSYYFYISASVGGVKAKGYGCLSNTSAPDWYVSLMNYCGGVSWNCFGGSLEISPPSGCGDIHSIDLHLTRCHGGESEILFMVDFEPPGGGCGAGAYGSTTDDEDAMGFALYSGEDYEGYVSLLNCRTLCDNAVRWVDLYDYHINNVVKINESVHCYICYQNHTSSTNTRPETGANWRDYWVKF